MTTPTPVRFQQFLDLIHYYLDKRGEYQEHIQYFQDELSEEMYLKEILESFDEREFQNLKDSIESFLENYEEEVKESHDSLDNLAIQLKEIIHHNNRLINKNKTLEKFYQQYGEQTKLTTQRVRAIEDKITDIYQILQDNDRNNYTQTEKDSKKLNLFEKKTSHHLKNSVIMPRISLPYTLNYKSDISHLELFREDFRLTQFKLTIHFSWKPNESSNGGILAVFSLGYSSDKMYKLEISSPSNNYGKISLNIYLKHNDKVLLYGSLLDYTGPERNIIQHILVEINSQDTWKLKINGNPSNHRHRFPILYKGERYTLESWFKKKNYELPLYLGEIKIGLAKGLPVKIDRFVIQH